MVGMEVQVPEGGVISVALGSLSFRVARSQLRTKYLYDGTYQKPVPVKGREQVVLPTEKLD